MLVRDVMQTDLVTIEASVTLRAVAGELLENRVGSVIVRRKGNAAGIITETDLVKAGFVSDRPFSEIPAENVMNEPLTTVGPDATLRTAVSRMDEHGIKKLPVLEDMDLVGIVTVSDVTGRYGDIVQEAHELDARRESWESSKLLENEVLDLEDS